MPWFVLGDTVEPDQAGALHIEPIELVTGGLN
jgi:hypothetical protein